MCIYIYIYIYYICICIPFSYQYMNRYIYIYFIYMYCLCQVLTCFMMFVFFENVGPLLGSIKRKGEESGYHGSMWYTVKRYWQGMFTCQETLEWIYYIMYMWMFICYQNSIKPFDEQAGAFEFVCEKRFFLFRVCKIFVAHQNFCMWILQLSQNSKIAFSKTSKQHHRAPDHGIPENPGMQRDVKVHPLQTPARAMQQLVPSQKT